ncbi:MAG: hypothetical protein ACJ74Z_22335 [Bryobacteraceae bacterium]
MLDNFEIATLFKNIASTVEQVTLAFRSSVCTREMRNRFWCLQDQIARLVELASDRREETFEILRQKHPRLIRDILDVLSSRDKQRVSRASAVNRASAAINHSLTRLEYLREESSAVAARANKNACSEDLLSH